MFRLTELGLDPRWNSPISALVTLVSVLPKNILVGIKDAVDADVGKIRNESLKNVNVKPLKVRRI